MTTIFPSTPNDAVGNFISQTNAKGVTTTDALGNEVLFVYDANNQLVKMTQNRVNEYHEHAEDLVTLYEYDGNGNMVSKTDGDGYVTEYTYNSLDLVSHISYNGAKEVTYQYNKVGELVKITNPRAMSRATPWTATVSTPASPTGWAT